jgi:hypothetical protein
VTRVARPIWLTLRQVLLLIATVVTCLVLSGLAGMLFSHQRIWAQVVSVLLFLPAVATSMGVWMWREDEADAGGKWLFPLSVCLLAIVIPVIYGLPTLYQDRYGEVVVAVVTEDLGGTAEPGSSQRIRVSEVTTGGDLGLLTLTDERDVRVGDEVRVLADPRDWVRSSDPERRNAGLWTAAYTSGFSGLAGLVVLTSLRAGRDIRRWSHAARHPAARSEGRPPRPARDRRRDETDGIPEDDDFVDDGGDSGDGHGGGGD